MRKLSRREIVLLGLVGVGALVLIVRWLWPVDAAAGATAALADPGPAVPRIDLARLDKLPSSSDAGRRNLFAFGAAVREDPEPRVFVPTPPPVTTPPNGAALAAARSPTPGLPPLNVKYIGSVENATGVKVAVLVTDRKEVLTGQAGQLVANRYRVAHIGLESVDLEDVSTGQSRRLPLRAQ